MDLVEFGEGKNAHENQILFNAMSTFKVMSVREETRSIIWCLRDDQLYLTYKKAQKFQHFSEIKRTNRKLQASTECILSYGVFWSDGLKSI